MSEYPFLQNDEEWDSPYRDSKDYEWYQENAALLKHIQRFATSLTEGGGHGQLILRFADGKFIGSDSEIRERHPLDLTAYRG